MKIAVSIPTYWRSDGKSKEYLIRAIKSVLDQSHTDWKIFLIGDRYKYPEELKEVIDLVPAGKIVFHNLKVAMERDVGHPYLWKFGGVHARNVGISCALTEGYHWVAALDHDDIWLPSHLSSINEVIEAKHDAAFICTVAKYGTDGGFLPLLLTSQRIVPYSPQPERLVHSSVCIDFHRLPFRYIDKWSDGRYKDPEYWLPADADLWYRISTVLPQMEVEGYCVNEITVEHTEEGFEREKETQTK